MKWENWVGLLGLALISVGHYQGLFVAPPEAMMGDVGRILYAHVPTAWVTLVVYVVAFFAAVGFLASGRRGFDALIESAVEVGVVLNLLLLFQGSVWAKPTWGVFWTWDPRLTTTAIMVVSFIGVLVLRAMLNRPIQRAVASAVYTILAFLSVPIVYLSVKWWKTLHQPFSSPETVDSPMVTPLRIAAFGMLFLAVFFMARRWRIAYAKLSREDEAPDLPPAAAAIQLEGGGS